jgi:hypothetical protein
MAGVYMELPIALQTTVSGVRLEGLNTYTTKHIIDGIAIFKIFFRSGQLSGIEVSTAVSAAASVGTLPFPSLLISLFSPDSCDTEFFLPSSTSKSDAAITGSDAVSEVIVNGLQMI